jgi:hypothetical protein
LKNESELRKSNAEFCAESVATRAIVHVTIMDINRKQLAGKAEVVQVGF